MKVDRSDDGLMLSQSVYAESVVEAACMSTAKPAPAPLPLAHPLYEVRRAPTAAEEEQMRDVPFCSILGALLYLSTRRRPDIVTAVSMLAKFQAEPLPVHWCQLKNVVRYVKGTTYYGIWLPARSNKF